MLFITLSSWNYVWKFNEIKYYKEMYKLIMIKQV